jgi:lipopolysaccharide/colanic/teichoic acid biosynthesis glycosyltransferase
VTLAPQSWRRWLGECCIRPLNLLVAGILIVLAAPAMVLIAFAVRVTSHGPVLYRQRRVGHDRRRRAAAAPGYERRSEDAGGRVFTMRKFRTMYDQGPEPLDEVRASPGDPRITRVGSFLRQHRLDELPQLFNVLGGDMNVVGPRPEQPGLFRELEARVPGYSRRQAVLPGITGWAQVNHGYDQSFEDVRRKVELDLEYIQRRSPAEDLGIMARTVPVMMWRRGSL